MKFTAGHIIALVALVAVFLGFDRWSTREDRWRERLAIAVRDAKVGDSTQHVADSLRHIRDSVVQDSIMARADTAEMDRNRIAQDNGRLRVQLAQARARGDTPAVIASQDTIIARQDAVIRSDSAQKVQLRAAIASKDESIVNLNTSLADARRRLADLIGVAERPPKEFKLLGFTLSLKPYLGYGIQVNPATGKADHGVQLGLSILRG